MRLAALIILLSACSDVADEVIPDPIDELADYAEVYCVSHPELPCGHVYLCRGTSAGNALGFVEVCTLDDNALHAGTLELAEAAFGQCEPTPRHQGLCWFGCGEGWRGCNALSGCFPCFPEPVP